MPKDRMVSCHLVEDSISLVPHHGPSPALGLPIPQAGCDLTACRVLRLAATQYSVPNPGPSLFICLDHQPVHLWHSSLDVKTGDWRNWEAKCVWQGVCCGRILSCSPFSCPLVESIRRGVTQLWGLCLQLEKQILA